jgi:hypothetical protein
MTDIVNLTSHYIGSPTPGVNLYQLPNASMQVLEDIINATWTEGQTTKAEFSAKIATALSGFLDITAAPHVSAGVVSVPSITEPTVTIPTSVTVDDVYDKWATEYLNLATWLDGKFTTFRSTYFPDENAAYTACEDWLQAAVANPDAGLPPTVAAQIWGDDAARILSDKTRAQDAVIAQFASRRFPLPPDAAASAVLQIEQKAQDDMASSSRKVAIMSVEMQKFNVESLLKLRDIAMRDAVEYVKALASAPEMTSRLSNIGYDAQSKLISSVSSFYGARSEAAKIMSSVAQYNNSTALDAAVKNQMADLTMIEDKLKALLAEAQSIAQMTTALFNNIHVSASLQANGGTTVSQSNEF